MSMYRSPVLSDTEKKERLIDTGLLHLEASVAGKNERYHKGVTSHTIHVWWARRPHSAMRALVFAALCKECSVENLELMNCLSESATPLGCLASNKILQAEYKDNPKVLDMFGGGGTIGFEAKSLGAEVFSIDSNQLSVFIQKCNLQYPDEIDIEAATHLLREQGSKLLETLRKKTAWMYPLRKNSHVFGYIWSYKQTCEKCGGEFFLIKRPFLSKKHEEHIYFTSTLLNSKKERLHIQSSVDERELFEMHWNGRSAETICPFCHSVHKKPRVTDCKDVVLALISKGARTGKSFNMVEECAIPEDKQLRAAEQAILSELHIELPKSQLPKWSGIVNPALYGIDTHADFMNKRQRLFILYLIRELIILFENLKKNDIKLAKFVVGNLSSLIDQLIDWNCRLSMWIPQNEQVGRAFCGPGIPMMWDYVETDPVEDGPANLWDKLERIISGVCSFKTNFTTKTPHVVHASAQKLPFECRTFDAIITDPPYYDNIYYSVLADFFYSWKKILLRFLEPELFEMQITDTKDELVASSHRVSEGETPHSKYCEQLSLAIQEAARVLKPDGVFAFVYSHSSAKGWSAIVQAFRESIFQISSVQPLSIERKARPRAITSQAVNTCVVFVARTSTAPKEQIDFHEILNRLQNELFVFGDQLISNSGWNESDAGLAVLASAIGLLANYSMVKGIGGDEEAILTMANVIHERYNDFTLQRRKSL